VGVGGTARAVTSGRKYFNYNVTRHKYNSDNDVCCAQVTQETAVGKTATDYQCCAVNYVHYSAGERCCNGTVPTAVPWTDVNGTVYNNYVDTVIT
jgi:hypothetical protein